MSARTEYRYTDVAGDEDDMSELDQTACAIHGNGQSHVSTERGDKRDGGVRDGGAFKEDGNGVTPSFIHSTQTRTMGGSPPSPGAPTAISVRPEVTAHTSDGAQGNIRRMPATSTMPPTFPSPSSVPTILNSFKKWSLDTFKYTKQYISERIGHTARTVDPEMDARVEALRDAQRQYLNILRLARALHLHFQRMVQTQLVLADAFGDMSQKNAELSEQFAYNAETQKLLSKNGEVLLGALNVFTTSLSTLCNTTIEDTLATVKLYEATRIKYDANRLYLESASLQTRDAVSIAKAQEAERVFLKSKRQFDQLRGDLIVKLRFLDENKVSVCQKHLFLLHNGFIGYVTGNRDGLDEVLRRVHETSTQQPVYEAKVTPSTGSSPDSNASQMTPVPVDGRCTVASDACLAAPSAVCHSPNE